MTRILLHGCSGAMGQMIAKLAKDEADVQVVAGVDSRETEGLAFPFYKSVADVKEAADVVIDFSVAEATDALLDACVAKKLPVVLCTTGLSEAQTAHMKEASKQIAVLKSANMSLGINLLLMLVKEITPALRDAGFDIEIVEQHHRRKVDAPSGTALALADAARDAVTDKTLSYTYDRSSGRQARDADEIGISAVRGGTIVGEHDVIFAGEDEVITLKHSAQSRAVFAKGALAAAKFLNGKQAGFYGMEDVLNA